MDTWGWNGCERVTDLLLLMAWASWVAVVEGDCDRSKWDRSRRVWMMLSVVWLSVVVRVICRWLRDIVMSVGCGFMKMKVYSLLRRLMMREVIWNVVVVVVSWMGSLRFRRAFLVAWGGHVVIGGSVGGGLGWGSCMSVRVVGCGRIW